MRTCKQNYTVRQTINIYLIFLQSLINIQAHTNIKGGAYMPYRSACKY